MSSFQKWLLTLTALVVTISGIAYGVIKYLGERLAREFPRFFPRSDDPFTAIRHPLQPWALDLHVLAAPVLVFAIGWIFKDHVTAKLASKAAPIRRSGVASLALVLPMVLSGYLLQTVTRESLRPIVIVTHIGAGLVFAFAYVLHLLLAPKKISVNGSKHRTGSPG